MRHRVAGRTFGRLPAQRKALFRGLATSLIDHERIETTISKARELRSVVEPLITLGKRGDLHARRQAASYLYGHRVVMKLFGEVAQRFKDRAGGYTRTFRVGRRRGDGAEMALIELLPVAKPAKKEKKPDKGEKTAKTAKGEEKVSKKKTVAAEGSKKKAPSKNS